MGTLRILTGDCAELLKGIGSSSIELCVTSPPYGNLRTYNGSCDWDFELVARELYRVLADGGVLCWNVGDEVVAGSETLVPFEQALFFTKVCGFRMHDRMIYEKLNFSHPERARYHQVFEDVFVLSKGAPRIFNPIKDKKNSTAGAIGNLGVNTFTERDGSKSERTKKVTAEFGMRGNVWKGKTRGQEEMCETLKHPAMMPRWLARDLILSFSNPGDVVLDPFVGSGTVCEEALKVGRKAIGIDRSEEYAAMAVSNCVNTTPGFALV